MNVNIICIGKLKEKYWQDAADEYRKRLGGYCSLRITELKEVRLPANAGAADEKNVIRKEGENILSKIAKDDLVIVLTPEGEAPDSPGLAKTLGKALSSGKNVALVIGGSLGLSDEVKKRADRLVSFSNLTFPHQLFRVMLLEQLYRSFKILTGETYHK